MRKRKKMLDLLGFEWDPQQKAWDDKMKQLRRFKAEKGHCNVNRHKDNAKLGQWLTEQRMQYKTFCGGEPWRSTLTMERIEQLEDIGIDWNPIESSWEERLDELKEFKNEVGHCNVPQEYKKNQSLSVWVQNQRSGFKAGTLETNRVDKLKALGFVFDMHEDAFEQGMERLLAFKKEFGHCRVPTGYKTDPQLWSFVARQRQLYKNSLNGSPSSLMDTRRERLNDVGFVWDARESSWESKFESLKQFKRKYGHCNVPSNYQDDPALAIFVSTQRENHKKKPKKRRSTSSQQLISEREKKLESLGFVWNTKEALWMTRYSELKRYHNEQGNCNVPSREGALGAWVRNQRVQYSYLAQGKKSSMTEERIKLLEKINFVWNLR